jgi:ribosomal protein S18 acetylase RimI-like enzyme
MSRIESYEQFTGLKNTAIIKSKWKKTNFLLPDIQIQNAIDNNRLNYSISDNQLLLTVHHNRAVNVYFYTDDTNNVHIPKIANKTVFSYYDNGNSEWNDFVVSNKLQEYNTALRMSAKTQYINKVTIPDEYKVLRNVNIAFKQLNELLLEYFDPILDNIPEEWEYDSFVKTKEIIQIFCNYQLAGFCLITTNGVKCIIEHIAVLPSFRNKGIGQMLLSVASEKSKYLQLWLHNDNIPAKKLYGKFGLTFDNVAHKCFII